MTIEQPNDSEYSALFRSFDPRISEDVIDLATSVVGEHSRRQDVETLMRHFCDRVEKRAHPGEAALGFIAEAFDRHLTTGQSLDKCMGLRSGRRGKIASPKTELRYKRAVSDAMAQYAVNDINLKKAKGLAADKAGLGKTQMNEAWSRWSRTAAIDLLGKILAEKVRAPSRSARLLWKFLQKSAGDLTLPLPDERARFYPGFKRLSMIYARSG